MIKSIAIVAHDRMKKSLLAWVKSHLEILRQYNLYATGSTGQLIEETHNLSIHKLESGPLGGDQQIGALIVNQTIDMLIFFWDPLEAQPHDPDVRALLRIAVVWNIPVACNLASADYLLTSTFMSKNYERELPEYKAHHNRKIN